MQDDEVFIINGSQLKPEFLFQQTDKSKNRLVTETDMGRAVEIEKNKGEIHAIMG